MKKLFKQLGQTDRDRIEALLDTGHKQKQIAGILKVDKSTISREIKKRKLSNGSYCATRAQQKARMKRKQSKYQGMKVESDPELKWHIVNELKNKRSPDEIAGRIKKERKMTIIGKDAIYRWLYSAWGQQYCKYLCTKRYKVKKPRKNKGKREMIPNKVSIHKRPLGATNKTRYGHFETDTAVSPKRVDSKEAVAVSTEIKSKLIIGTKIESMSYHHMTSAMQSFQDKVHMLSSTTDNGIENKGHKDWGLPTFFADPHSPWQKPLVEASIGLLRRWFFKKGTDWSTITEKELQEAFSTLNNKYRKSLNYASALEVALAHGIINSDPNKKSCI
jgi:transposase, IS30 family